MCKKTMYLTSFVLIFTLVELVPARENLIIDGSFEINTDGTPGNGINSELGASWHAGSAGGNVDVTTHWDKASTATSARSWYITDDGTDVFPDGDYAWRLDGRGDIEGTNWVYQDGITLYAGLEYLFSIDFWGVTGENPLLWVQLVKDQTVIELLDGVTTDTSDGAYETKTAIFMVSESGEYRLQLSGDVDVRHDDHTWVDNASLFLLIPPQLAIPVSPANGETGVDCGAILSWLPGESAYTHNVYFGTVFDDVNDAVLADAVSPGQTGTTYDPNGRLDLGQPYFWRIDEVNAPPDSTVFKGDVWSFTTEPVGYPIDGANLTVTASSTMFGSSPELTIDGSGLDDNDLHSTVPETMWLSDMAGPQPTWIEYEFDKVYKLHEMWVWNQNQLIESTIGYGFKDVTIEYSVDGVTYSTLGTTHEFTRGPGLPGYPANTTVNFEGAEVKYVKLTANSNWSPFDIQQYGLSEVRFLYLPVWAREPVPGVDASNVDVMNLRLTWKAGREAAEHDVYLSTDEQAVIDGSVPFNTVTETSYAPPSLDLGTTYFWRVDEVNDAQTPTTWAGNIWNFTTIDSIVVEDFEAYNDIPETEEGSNLVYYTWVDGYVDPPQVRTNGSTMGYTIPFEPTMEFGVVHGGAQSAPLDYDNTVASYSEVTANVSDLQFGPDWSQYGIGTLTVWYYGDPNNAAQQLYVKVNNNKILQGNPESLKQASWQPWPIDLTPYNVSNVTTLTIGLDRLNGVGGKGIILLDDIELGAAPPEVGSISQIENFNPLDTSNMQEVEGW